LYARFLADGYVLGDLVEFRGALAVLNSALVNPLQGQASLTTTPDGTSYSGSLSSDVSSFSGLPAGLFTARISGDDQRLDVDQLEYRTPGGGISYKGTIALDPIVPNGEIVIDNLAIADSDPVSTVVAFESVPSGFLVVTDPFVVAEARIEQLTWQVAYAESISTTFSLATGRRSDSRLRINSTHRPDWSLTSAALSAEQFDLPAVVTVVEALAPGAVPFIGTVVPQALRLSTDSYLSMIDGVSARIEEFVAYDEGNPRNEIRLTARYDGRELLVDDISGRLERQTLQGSLEMVLGETGTSLSSAFILSGTEYAVTGTVTPASAMLAGERGSELRLDFGNDGAVSFRGAGSFPLPEAITSSGSEFAYAVSGRFASPELWQIDLEEFTVSGVSAGPLRNASIDVAATLSERGLLLSRFEYEDSYSVLVGDGGGDWNLAESEAQFDLRIANASDNGEIDIEGSELYRVFGRVEDDRIDGTGTVRGLPLQRLGIEAISGTVDLDLAITGTLQDPEARMDLVLANARFNNDPVELNASASFADRRIQLDSGRARIGRTRLESVTGGIDLGGNSAELAAQLLQLGEGKTLVVNIDAAGEFESLGGVPDVVSSPFSGVVTLAGIPSVSGNSTWELVVERDESATRVSGGPEDALSLTLASDGTFDARVGGALPVSFNGIGYLESGAIEADLIGVTADLQRIWSLIGPTGVVFTGGTGVGSLRIVGPVNDPDFYGTLVVTDITADVEWIENPAGPARTFIVFEEKVVTIREATVVSGDGAADISAVLTLDRWGLEEFLVSIRTIDGRPLPVDTSFGRVEIAGDAAGSLSVRGGNISTVINGDLTASNMSVTLGPVPENPPTPDPVRDVTADVALQTGRGVEFLWPSEAFPILRGFADTDEQIRIAFESGNGTFAVDGAVAIQGGEVFYFDRSFYISEGAISFAEDETAFDPRLSVNAEIREVGEDGPITIYLVADERPLSEFSPQWRSDPPLSEAAILTLLGGTVFVGESGQPIDLSQAVLLTSDVVSQFGLIRNFESGVRDALNLDLFSIRTQLFQNLLRGVIDQNDAIPLDSAVPSLGEYLDNTTLFAGRYLGTDLFLELLVQLRQSETSALGQQSLTGIEIDSEVSLEWETPFFQLEWAFFPRDPSSLFLADNTIRFSWDYSY
jgi:hypothetical protein